MGINEAKIIEMIAKDPYTNSAKIALELGISETAVENNIKKLKEKKAITRVGSRKAGHWEILK